MSSDRYELMERQIRGILLEDSPAGVPERLRWLIADVPHSARQDTPGLFRSLTWLRRAAAPLVVGVAMMALLALIALPLLSHPAGGSGSGSITFSPSTLSCKTPVAVTATARLPSSVHAADVVAVAFDGESGGTHTVADTSSDTKQQPDGSWVLVFTATPDHMQMICAAGGSSDGLNVLTPGTHTMQVLDATGKVLAQGSYSVTP